MRDHASRLPDLSHCTILLPVPCAAPRLRRLLLEEAADSGTSALLAPRITTLAGWLDQFHADPRPVATPQQRELMLLEALQRAPALCGDSGPWVLSDSLLSLFDELARHDSDLSGDADALSRRLARGYGLDDPALHEAASPLSREARLVAGLWRAWQEQHTAEGLCDPWQSRRERLAASLRALPQDMVFYFVPGTDLPPADAAWLRYLLEQGRLRVLLRATPADGRDPTHYGAVPRRLLAALGRAHSVTDKAPADDPAGEIPEITDYAFGAFIEITFAPHPDAGGADLATRARRFARRHPASPATERLFLYAAADPEDEARAVELQVRRWLLAGLKRIAIVTEDRRLARRIRALLERAGITLQDHGGWALSTTSAAATLERLLQTAEEDYAHEPLLDLLKSPFVLPELAREDLLRRVYRLEQDIILHENISRGLDRYRRHLAYRCQRLAWPRETRAGLEDLLDRLEAACSPLQALAACGAHPPSDMLAALHRALQTLGMDRSLAADPAGLMVLETLEALAQAAQERDLRFTWTEFRIWLGRSLEQATFNPPQPGESPVRLFTLAQSALECCDGLIVAAADDRHLPGPPPANPFFNDAVRIELGLTPLRRRRTEAFYHFRRLLESAPHVLFTYHRQEDGEDLQPAPWLALLDTSHRLAYGTGLADGGLGVLCCDPATEVVVDDAPLPAPRTMPRPAAVLELLPREYSATRYQRLLDCPYLFHAADCLGLTAPERIREALEKSDYGARVHRILERFHDPAAGRDAPLWRNELATAQRELEAISREEFRRDLEDNIVHRGWLQRWLKLIPAYLAWQRSRGTAWRVSAVEVEQRVETTPVLKGRIDRIDRAPDGSLAVLDYKTGAIPTPAEVQAGEAVQLPWYALLISGEVTEVLYLGLGKDEIKVGPVLAGEVLHTLREAVRARLVHLHHRLQEGADLPAWGDDGTCRHCPMSGLCRRQAWDETEAAP